MQQQKALKGRAIPMQHAIGEFVLVYAPVPRNKMRIQWLGPFRVVDTIHDWVYVVEDINTHTRRSVHTNRIKPYADKKFAVTEDVYNQVAYDTKFHFDFFVDWRENNAGKLELRVRWVGFEANEDSWEPVDRVHEDIPILTIQYLRTIAHECLLAQLKLKEWGASTNEGLGRRKRRAPPPRGQHK